MRQEDREHPLLPVDEPPHNGQATHRLTELALAREAAETAALLTDAQAKLTLRRIELVRVLARTRATSISSEQLQRAGTSPVTSSSCNAAARRTCAEQWRDLTAHGPLAAHPSWRRG
jgi:hypothetical protein